VSDLVYLYGFVPAPVRTPTEPLTGLGGHPVEVLSLAGFGAVVSHVPARDFGQERVEQNLQNLAWVAEQGIAHERVVAFFVDEAEILPASLFTLYSNDAALRSASVAQQETILAELRRLAGVREWNLKVSYDATVLARELGRVSESVEQLDREIAEAAPGRRVLLEKKRAELTKTEVARAARTEAQRVLDAVTPLCRAVRSLPLPQSKEALPVVLHAALLVERAQEAAVVAQLERAEAALAGGGVTLTFSGPWAPYRFVRHESA
jgi:hypothetical protein